MYKSYPRYGPPLTSTRRASWSPYATWRRISEKESLPCTRIGNRKSKIIFMFVSVHDTCFGKVEKINSTYTRARVNVNFKAKSPDLWGLNEVGVEGGRPAGLKLKASQLSGKRMGSKNCAKKNKRFAGPRYPFSLKLTLITVMLQS